MFKSRGFAAIVPLLLLGIGLVVAVALVGTQTGFFNRASGFPETGTNPSPWGKAMQLNGQNYASPSARIYPKLGFTVEMWARPNSAVFNGYLVSELGQQTFGNKVGTMSLSWASTPDNNGKYVNNYNFSTTNAGANCAGTQIGYQELPQDASEVTSWHHLAVVFGLDGKIRLFLNGQLMIASEAITGVCPPVDDIYLGRGRSTDTSPEQYFPGQLDEVRISTVARYLQNFTPPTTPFMSDADTIALYHFDGPIICQGPSNNCFTADSSNFHRNALLIRNPQFVLSTIPHSVSPNDYVKNGSFELVKDNGKPAEWKSGSLKDNDKVVTTEYFEGTKSFRFTGKNTTGREALGQLVTVNGSANDIVTLTVRNKSTGAAATGGLAGMAAIITYNDGKVDAGYYTFPKSVHDWRLKKAILVPDEPYKSIVITLLNQNGAANYFVDDVKLTIEPGQESDQSKATPSELPIAEVKKLIVQ